MIKNTRIAYCFRGFNSEKPKSTSKHVNLQKDYYKILEITSTTNQVNIKKSYFRLAKKLHPDVNPKGHLLFTEIQQAYDVLSNKQSKEYYDMNNGFYVYSPKSQEDDRNHSQQFNDMRNKAFYEEMKRKSWSQFCNKQKQSFYERRYQEKQRQRREEQQEMDQQTRQKKKFEEQIQITRRILFTKNPIWERANAFMNYQQRRKIEEEKQKQLERLFPKSTELANKFKKWIFR